MALTPSLRLIVVNKLSDVAACNPSPNRSASSSTRLSVLPAPISNSGTSQSSKRHRNSPYPARRPLSQLFSREDKLLVHDTTFPSLAGLEMEKHARNAIDT